MTATTMTPRILHLPVAFTSGRAAASDGVNLSGFRCFSTNIVLTGKIAAEIL